MWIWMGIRSDDRCGRDFGTDHVQHTTCGKGSCCSSHGWCGTTAPQHRPSTSPRPDQPRRPLHPYQPAPSPASPPAPPVPTRTLTTHPRRPLHPAPRPPSRRPRTRRRCGTSEEYCSVALGCQSGCWKVDAEEQQRIDAKKANGVDDDEGYHRRYP